MPSALLATASAPAAEAVPAAALADLFAVLAAAFAPPPAALSVRDWCEPLAADLAELGGTLALDTAAAQRSLREFALGPLAGEPWMVEYSRLFLVPPVPVTLNTALYLEGALGGASAQMMAQCYAAAGFSQRETFRDLPDHAAMQLEFLSALLERGAAGDDDALAMAQEFAAGFVAHWAPLLRRACVDAAATDPASAVYSELARLLEAAIDRLAG